MTGRVAVLVDGDNVAPSHADRILNHARTLGRVDIARVYAAEAGFKGWEAVPGFRLFHVGAGKNAADLLLAIDAMDLALTDRPDTVVIASSDRDFTHLALRLREKALAVVGMGEAKAPECFRAACSGFSMLPAKTPIAVQTTTAPLPARENDAATLDHKIRTLIAQHSKNGMGMRITELAPKMHQLHGTKISLLPDKTWRAYLSHRPELYDLDEKGQDAMVRFKAAGFLALSAHQSAAA